MPSERRLSQIETWHGGSRPYFLTEDDKCFYYGEYTPRAGYSYGATNNLISNFKKNKDRQGKPEWRYKTEAIEEAGALLAECLNVQWLRTATLVPVPPSKAQLDPLYDDRLNLMLQRTQKCLGFALDIRELLYQTESTRSSSQSGTRLSIEELQSVYRIDEALTTPKPSSIGIFDDLISAGRHFRVAKDLLQMRFPEVEIYGFFLARTLEPDTP
jgi:hypothetical protein